MNLLPAHIFAVARRWLVAGLTILVLGSRVSAQPAPQERWLFIFDTSAGMKKCLPGTEAEIKSLLASSVGGQLHPEDSVGVWTFGQERHVGQFPLVTWDPEQAVVTASNLAAFVHKQNYAGDTSWPALQPLLGQVIKESERLTLVIFCDGLGTIDWTTYNDGINRTFSQTLAERKKARQPFVLLVRTQHGQFTGCTINFPPGALNVPPFPPLPEPVKIIPPIPPPVVVKPPPVVVPSLVIVGTNVGTNLGEVMKNIPAPATNLPVAPPVLTNTLPVSNHIATAVVSNPPPLAPQPAPQPAPPAKITEVKAVSPVIVAAPVAPPNVAPTNATPAAVPADTDHGGQVLKYVGVSLFAAAAGPIIFLWVRAVRRPRGSLITSSMQNDPRPPPRK